MADAVHDEKLRRLIAGMLDAEPFYTALLF